MTMKQKTENYFIIYALVLGLTAFVFFYLAYTVNVFFSVIALILGFISLYFVEEFFRNRGHKTYPIRGKSY